MTAGEQKIVQYLNEAHAMEQGLTRVLEAQIAMAPRGTFRQGLERHLTETDRHAERLRTRLSQLDGGSNPLELGMGLVESVVGQALALAKTPLDLLRGHGGEEKVLKNAKDACASESLEIATYTALERVAASVGDTRTAELARSICADEQRMLDRLLGELPQLADGVVGAEVRGEPTYELSKTGAADAVRATRRSAERSAGKAKRSAGKAKRSAGKAKLSAGKAKRSAGKAKRGSATNAKRASRPATTASSATRRTTSGSSSRRRSGGQRAVGAHEGSSRRASGSAGGSGRANSSAGTNGPDSNRTKSTPADGGAREPWPGYDRQTVDEIRAALDEASAPRARKVRTYEEAHEERSGVIETAERAAS